MNGKSLRGIDGVLGNLISSPIQNMADAHKTTQQTKPRVPSIPVVQRATANGCSAPQGARRGRPLGRPCDVRRPKEKVTLRISSELATEYRDWSWEARCSLSALVEKALADYSRGR